MKNFEHIELQLSYQETYENLTNTFDNWKPVPTTDEKEMYFNHNLLNWESKNSQGI